MTPPPVRPFARGHVRAQTAREAADFDRRAIDETGIPERVLMENAGRAAAMVARSLFPAGSSPGDGGAERPRLVAGLVGSGNNGGDALVALRSFAAWGHRVRAILVSDRPDDDPLLHGWPVEVLTDEDLDDEALDGALASAGLLLDGILGTGIRGAPRERQARVIDAVNRAERPVVALDIPSGADATTGDTPGAVVQADVTVSFGAPKLGALLHPARRSVGRQVTVEIGFPPMTDDDASAFLVTPSWARQNLPRRDTDTHKNRVGRVVVVGGGRGMAGAAILAGRAAFRAGAGLVQIATAPGNREAVHAALPEAIVVTWDDEDALREALEDADGVVVGPGLGRGEEAAGVLRRVAEAGDAPMVLDADGLNLVADGVVDLEAVAAVRDVLVTPHPGEMKRLMADAEGASRPEGGASRPEVGASPPEIARWAADRFGCVVLLKGAPSLVAAQERPMAVDTQSSSDQAVAGMGDTLSGVCGALMAQGLGAADAGALGLYLSGRAAWLAGRGAGLTPSDVADTLPEAIGATAAGSRTGTGGESELAHLPFVVFDADAAR